MKVALVHDYIKEYGGAERVLEALHEIWPSAPVFTTVYLPEFLGPHRERFAHWDIRCSFLQGLPLKHKLISPFRIISPFVFKRFDFSQYDLLIVSATGAYCPNGKWKMENGKSPLHICYCHTPPRYLYGFATAREWKKNLIFRVIGEIGNHFLRLIDFKSAQNVDYFIANSKNVAARIKKFCRKDSTVIYPPVEMNQESRIKNQAKKTYFLAGGRIAKPKHIDLIAETFTKLKLPLKVFGRTFTGHDSSFMIHNSNIEFVGEVSDEEKLELMKNAKAYIFASEDEDFGITPVEAMSCGTPVIAYRSGGVVESIVEGKTGIFFDKLTVESLVKAMKQFNNLIINPSDCINQARKFSKERFKKEIIEFILRATIRQPTKRSREVLEINSSRLPFDKLRVARTITKRRVVLGVGAATFFFGFGAAAILNIYLLATHSPLVLHFRSSLMYISSIFGDGIILPIVNIVVISSFFKYQDLIGRLTVILSLFFGLLITLYFHIGQAVQGLVNWTMPKPWHWNFLGLWHALYMFAVASLLSLFYIILAVTIKKHKRLTKEAVLVTLGIVLFLILLRLDYISVKLI